jgi:hypothetical protein
MKTLFGMVAILALVMSLSACGSTSKARDSGPRAAASLRFLGDDSDDDSTTWHTYDDDDRSIVEFGHAATPTEAEAIGVVATRYMRAAAAGKGKAACSMNYAILEEAIVEDYGTSPPGPPYLRGTTCAQVMTKVFKRNRERLGSVAGSVHVVRVRVDRLSAYAMLSFGPAPPRHYLLLHKEHAFWKIDALLDRELT